MTSVGHLLGPGLVADYMPLNCGEYDGYGGEQGMEGAVNDGACRPEIIVLEHSRYESLGTLAPILEARAHLNVMRAYEENLSYARRIEAAIRTSSFDAVIVLGGPVSLLDKEIHAYLADSLRLVRAALKKDVPLLGIGLGAHMVAWELGGLVWHGHTRGREPEIGWYPVSLTRRGRVDPALHRFDEVDSVFHWHADSFDLPLGAWLLASTPRYQNQAFRWGRWVYGFEFHVEVTGRMVEDLVDARASELHRLKRVDPDLLVAKAARYVPRLRARAETLALHFCECIATSMAEKSKLGLLEVTGQ